MVRNKPYAAPAEICVQVNAIL